MHISWQVKCQLIGAFSLVSDIQWIHCQYLQQIEIYLEHQYSESVSNKSLALCWRQNGCLGRTFLVFSCWAIWRVITCSPLTLQQCFINTAQHLLPYSQKHCQTPVHNLACGHSGEILQVVFQIFQNSVKTTYIRHFFNFKCVLQIFI